MATYLGIFGAVLSTIILPLPEEVALLGAGWLAHEGRAYLPACVAAAWLAILIGDVGTFYVGRTLLARLLEWRPIARALPRRHREWAEALVARHGWRAVLLGRFLVGLRPVVFLSVGASGLSPWRFVLLDGLVGVVEVGLLVGTGYLYGHVRAHTGTWIDLIAAFILGLALFGPLVVKKRFNAARQSAA